MSADVIHVNFETGTVLDVKRGSPSLLRRVGKTVLAKLSLVEISDEQSSDYYIKEATRLGIAIDELKEEREMPGSFVAIEEMRSLENPFYRAMAQLSPEDQMKVWNDIAPEKE